MKRRWRNKTKKIVHCNFSHEENERQLRKRKKISVMYLVEEMASKWKTEKDLGNPSSVVRKIIFFNRMELEVVDVICQRSIFHKDVMIRFQHQNDEHLVGIQVCLGDHEIYCEENLEMENPRNFIVRAFEYFFEKTFFCQLSSCRDSRLREVLESVKFDVSDGDQILHGKDNVLGYFVYEGTNSSNGGSSSEEDALEDVDNWFVLLEGCEKFCYSPQQKYCENCKQKRKRFGDNLFVKPVVSEEGDEEEDSVDVNRNERIYTLLDEALRKKKLKDGMRSYDALCDQLILLSCEPNGIRSRLVPKTMQALVNNKIRGEKGFRGKWVKSEEGVTYYDGFLVFPSEKCLSRFLSNFRLFYGVTEKGLELASMIIDALTVIYGYWTFKIDWLEQRIGLNQVKVNKVRYLFGLVDYGTYNSCYGEVKKTLYSSLSEVKVHQQKARKCIVRAISAVEWMENYLTKNVQKAKYCAAFCGCLQASLSDHSVRALSFPLMLLQEHSLSNDVCRFTMNMCIMGVSNFIEKKKKKGVKSFQCQRIDSFVADSQSGLVKLWKLDGDFSTEKIKNLKLKIPNVMSIPSLSIQKPLLHICLNTDNEHLLKEFVGQFRKTTGFESTQKLFIWCTEVSRGNVIVCPVTYRVIMYTLAAELRDPTQMNNSDLGYNSVYPKHSEKMRTKLNKPIISRNTTLAVKHRFLDEFEKTNSAEEEQELMEETGLTKIEVMGTLDCLKFFHDFFLEFEKKTMATDLNRNNVHRMVCRLINQKNEVYRIIKENDFLSKTYNFFPVDFIDKCIKNGLNYLSLYNSRKRLSLSLLPSEEFEQGETIEEEDYDDDEDMKDEERGENESGEEEEEDDVVMDDIVEHAYPYEVVIKKFESEFIPHSAFSDNDVESCFETLRHSDGHHSNVDALDIHNRSSHLLIKKNDNIMKKVRANCELTETCSMSEVLLQGQNFKDIKKMRKAEVENFAKYIKDRTKTDILLPKFSELKEEFEKEMKSGDVVIKQRFGYRIGYLLFSATNKCRGSKRQSLASEISFLEKKSKFYRKIVRPCEQLVDLMLKIDFYLRRMVTPLMINNHLSVLQEIMYDGVIEEFEEKFLEKVWKVVRFKREREKRKEEEEKHEENKIMSVGKVVFGLIIDIFVYCRMRDILKNLGLSHDPGSRTFRKRF